MPTEEFDPNEALNRILNVVTPFRATVQATEDAEQIQALTTVAFGHAVAAVGQPLTQEVMTGLLFAAVLRLADMWNAESSPMEIPDSLPDA